MELLKSIAPAKLQDLVGNKLQTKKLTDALADPEQKLVIISGPIGCGKTLLSKLALRNFNTFEVISKEYINIAKSFVVNKTISCFEANPKRKAVFIDNVDVFMSTESKSLTLLEELWTIINTKSQAALIITCKMAEERQVTTVFTKENPMLIKLGYPQIRETFLYLIDKLPEIPEEKLLALAKKYKGCIRDTVLNLYDTSPDEQIVSYKEYNNFEIVSAFFLNPAWKTINAILNCDPSLTCYLLYENILDEIYNNREALAVMKSYLALSDYFLAASIIDKYMQDNMDWELLTVSHCLKLGGMYCILNALKKKASRKDYTFRFSQVLSKQSHKNSMQKKLAPNLHSVNIPTIDMINLIDSKQVNKTYSKNFVTYNKYFCG